ncbi:unnamed protein product [Didymodactylos carnosus]|uniref:Uncharacterized protein n=1 Tax=Didymodactylos carnosus TaxID=1234261 RepID=A0A814C8Q6_9BILA|nr:unnamed protein product [Didymodactylos carnosus]CAF0936917.1 unnamed protein product [Didymodactylos carnosus]CAF3620051.1 unnamed protein product [Didymodactylos carnosus]CAF3713968.1 unnamed protein product [Didymodactylos carnosus]
MNLISFCLFATVCGYTIAIPVNKTVDEKTKQKATEIAEHLLKELEHEKQSEGSLQQYPLYYEINDEQSKAKEQRKNDDNKLDNDSGDDDDKTKKNQLINNRQQHVSNEVLINGDDGDNDNDDDTVVMPYIDPHWAREQLAEYYRYYEPLDDDEDDFYSVKSQVDPSELKMYAKQVLDYLKEQHKYEEQEANSRQTPSSVNRESLVSSSNSIMDDSVMQADVNDDNHKKMAASIRRRRSLRY